MQRKALSHFFHEKGGMDLHSEGTSALAAFTSYTLSCFMLKCLMVQATLT